MVNIGRCVIKKRMSFGGTQRVFYVPDHKNSVEVVNGAKLASTGLQAGDKIFAGDFGSFNYKTGVVTALKCWKVIKAVGATDTTVELQGGAFAHLLQGDVILGKAGGLANNATTAATTTGVSVSASNIAVSGDKYILTITANDFGTLAVGDVLVVVSATGTSKAVAVPSVNWMFAHDIDVLYTVTSDYITNVGSAEMTAAGYFSAAIYQDAKVIPPYVKALNKLSNNDYVFKL